MSCKNSNYVIYDQNDNYLVGFNNALELSKFLRHNTNSSTSHLLHRQKKTYPIYKVEIENGLLDCSQKLYEYENTYVASEGIKLYKGASIYKFWTESR